MDKQAMKAALAGAGLAQVPYVCTQADELSVAARREALLNRIEAELGYPCFVKPANLGSSVGISKVRNRDELLQGLSLAASLDPRLVVEQGVQARELECAVLGGTTLRASVVGEVRFDADWYDYDTKYTEGRSTTLIPAPLPEAIVEAIRSQSIQACAAVGVTGMARVDFFYDDSSGKVWLNEINTLPGFTSQSMYPMLWEASGVTLEQLVHELLQAQDNEMTNPADQGGAMDEHGLLWFPLLAFVLLAALGWLERRRQTLFRTWAEGAELVKLDGWQELSSRTVG